MLREEGIRVGFFLQLGYLGENLDDILATRRLVDEARPDDVGVSVAYPLPGTKFYELVKEQIGDKRHWQESSDLEMMFHGTYTSDFYRAVRNLLHDQVTHRALRRCTARWNELIEREEEFRHAPRATAIAPAAGTCAGFRLSHAMTDILLTHGYFLAEDEKERQIMKPYPPLGLLYLSAFLKSARILGRGVRQHVRRSSPRSRQRSRPRPAAWSASTPTS